MRVTTNMLINTFVNDLHRNLEKINQLQHQISTGKKITFPSDNPIDADRLLDYRSVLDETAQYVKNIDDSTTYLQNTDTTLGDIDNLFLRARDLAVRGANEATLSRKGSSESRLACEAIAKEIDSLTKELLVNANRKFDNKYIFAGFKTKMQAGGDPFELSNNLKLKNSASANDQIKIPLPSATAEAEIKGMKIFGIELQLTDYIVDAENETITITNYSPALQTELSNRLGHTNIQSGDEIQSEIIFNKNVSASYKGDNGLINVEVSEAATISVNIPGATTDSDVQSVFGLVDEETDIPYSFKVLYNLRDNLLQYDLEGVQNAIDEIDEVKTNVLNVRTEIGGRLNRLEMAKNRLKRIEIDTKKLLSEKEDVDLAEAISDLAAIQTTYKAALGVGAMIIQPTLLDFLR